MAAVKAHADAGQKHQILTEYLTASLSVGTREACVQRKMAQTSDENLDPDESRLVRIHTCSRAGQDHDACNPPVQPLTNHKSHTRPLRGHSP